MSPSFWRFHWFVAEKVCAACDCGYGSLFTNCTSDGKCLCNTTISPNQGLWDDKCNVSPLMLPFAHHHYIGHACYQVPLWNFSHRISWILRPPKDPYLEVHLWLLREDCCQELLSKTAKISFRVKMMTNVPRGKIATSFSDNEILL